MEVRFVQTFKCFTSNTWPCFDRIKTNFYCAEQSDNWAKKKINDWRLPRKFVLIQPKQTCSWCFHRRFQFRKTSYETLFSLIILILHFVLQWRKFERRRLRSWHCSICNRTHKSWINQRIQPKGIQTFFRATLQWRFFVRNERNNANRKWGTSLWR